MQLGFPEERKQWETAIQTSEAPGFPSQRNIKKNLTGFITEKLGDLRWGRGEDGRFWDCAAT